MFAMAARETYFITTPRTLGILDNMIITLISTMREIIVLNKANTKAGTTLLKFSQWLTAYFIIYIPFLTSFSTLICIIIEATNLAIIISGELAGLILNCPFVVAYFQMHNIMITCTN
jgi:hypothetical protein